MICYIIGGKVLTMTGEIWEKGYVRIEGGKRSEERRVGKEC